MSEKLSNTALLQLLRLCSPSLPIGSYSYSQGLETACDLSLVNNAGEAKDWFEGIMRHGLGKLDVPLLLRMYQAWELKDHDQPVYWSKYLLACRESRELRAEDQQTGRSLARLLRDMDTANADICMDKASSSLALSFSLAAYEWGIPQTETAHAYLWSWLENQVAAAIKLIPIGQTDGQKILSSCMPVIEECVAMGLQVNDDEIYGSLPGFAMLSARHEIQYSRLFQS